ncbi:phosphatase PAP2 family protein [Kineococcus sp. SYSU DK005]|uniref:phosphatase PAP2 family protein n=1 Tax=Kineococcus sp. SYSU DK005 TaxID=3383126 RepID=UPI003D7CB87F
MTSSTVPTAPAPPRRGAERRGAGALTAAALLHAAALAVLYAVCVRTARGQAAEDAVHEAALRSADAGLPAPGERLLHLAGHLEPVHLLAGAGLVVLAGLARRSPARAGLGLAVAAATLGATELLKLVVLQRPDLVEAASTHNSLPSGHTAGVLGVCLGLLAAAPPCWRWVLAPAGALASGAMAAMVVAEGWHRVSDPLASALVGSAAFALAQALAPERPRRGRAPAVPRRGRVAALAAGVPAACAAALVAAYAVPGAGLGTAVAAPGLAVAATVLLAAGALPRRARARA